MAWKWLGNGKTAARPAIAALSMGKKEALGRSGFNRGRVDLITTQTISRRFNSRAREERDLPTPRQANKPEPGKNLEQR